LLAAADAHAQQFVPTGRDTLRLLPGVEVLVEPLAPELAPGGLTGAFTRASIEGQLKAGRIQVYTSQTENPSPAKAYLYINVTGLPLQGQGYVLSVQVQLRQSLRSVVTMSNIVNAMTWDQQVVVVVPAATALQSVSEEIRSLVSQFIQDWRAVH
jgi:hypothetical protein